MQKQILAVIITVATVVLVIAIIFTSEFYNSQTSNLHTPTPTTQPTVDACITDFYYNGSDANQYYYFAIEIQNNGSRDANLTLTFNSTYDFKPAPGIGFYNYTARTGGPLLIWAKPYSIGTFQKGQSQTFFGWIANDPSDTIDKLFQHSLIATLKAGDTVLDQASIKYLG
jgi:hypothetical protein